MRTTLDLNDDLLAEAKAFAGREKLTLTRLIEEGLALRLRQGMRPSAAAPLPLPVHQGRGGLGPAVADPRSNRALLDAADGWIAAAVLARRECLATFDGDFVPLLPARQLVLLNP